jgi:hypothetical protein
MLNLKEWMELVDYKITEGSTYGWQCFGDNAYQLDSWNGDQNGHSFTITFDTKTQEVYQVEAHDFRNGRAYRIINTNYAPKHMMESANRGVKDEAWEDVDYVDLECDDDFMQKALAIAEGEDYDTRVSIPVDFTDAELLKYMKLAHERDITLNQFIEEALRAAIEDYNRDPEGMKSKADQWKASRDIT